MQYKIVDNNYYQQDRYCPECGNKTYLVPTGTFDSKTGKPEAKLECRNLKCSTGISFLEDK